MHWIDPNCLPETRGVVEAFIANRHGEVDGILLAVKTQPPSVLICTPPHLGDEIEAAVRIGDTIRVYGVRPRGTTIVAAVALTAGNDKLIIDNGPGQRDKHSSRQHDVKSEPMYAEGAVRVSLFGPKGELRGALLTDGAMIRIGPREALSFAELFSPGSPIAVSGAGLQTRHGPVIAVEAAGPNRSVLKPVKARREDAPPQSGAPSVAEPG